MTEAMAVLSMLLMLLGYMFFVFAAHPGKYRKLTEAEYNGEGMRLLETKPNTILEKILAVFVIHEVTHEQCVYAYCAVRKQTNYWWHRTKPSMLSKVLMMLLGLTGLIYGTAIMMVGAPFPMILPSSLVLHEHKAFEVLSQTTDNGLTLAVLRDLDAPPLQYGIDGRCVHSNARLYQFRDPLPEGRYVALVRDEETDELIFVPVELVSKSENEKK